ncbi:hypothetical protein IWQ60_007880 [Tieghemiomyces parasiticus]|uniref:Yeast cell wall synthesis Kre9/Knh1-like N-terminal domain-containing protein n=1 Tax=Tieghemiomyces parasiticus TaxID=78921 RepID=A0A9W8DT12_9FUNG|nr:hypothetical protein IWQ60_007880 [Tieghemiomyces parasiticus]
MSPLPRVFLAACLLVLGANAIVLEVLHPFSQTVWHSGQKVKVQYSLQPDAGQRELFVNEGEKFDAYLVKGGNFEYVKLIKHECNLAEGGITFTVPNVEPGNDYYVRIGNYDNNNFSHVFTIQNPNGNVRDPIDPSLRAEYDDVYHKWDRVSGKAATSSISGNSLASISTKTATSKSSSATATASPDADSAAGTLSVNAVACGALTTLGLLRFL